ncbi:MAG: putative zinc protease [Syntrophus sp. SKADARSKE-3]|nr:putative zinc protease [Syntrophus sp. SKADARSKE-3]
MNLFIIDIRYANMNKRNFTHYLILALCAVILQLYPNVLYSSDSANLERQIKSFTLDNGLQVLMMERHINPTVSLYIRYRAGAVDEGEGQTGLAHLLEHMMFKGTKTIGTKSFKKEQKILRDIDVTGQALDMELARGDKADKSKIDKLKANLKLLQERHKPLIISNEIDRLYKENGATGLNASTGQDLTTYHVSLPSNKIELWARIESDRMINPIFREFYQERDVVLEEQRQRVEANPEGKLYEAFLGAAFLAHPYRRPVIGWKSDIQHLTMNDLKSFYSRHHAPGNTVIAVVGDIDPEKVKKLIVKYFGSIPNHRNLKRPMTEEPLKTGEKRVNIALDANPHLIIGFHKPPPPDSDDDVFEMIESILSRGRTSRFYKTLVEKKGIAEDVQASNGTPGSRYANLFAIFASPRHPHSSSELETSIIDMIDQLKKEPVSEKELQKVKNQVRADFIHRQSSNSGMASMLSYYQALLGDFRYMITYIDRIDKISSDDIMRVAKKYLTTDNRTVATIVKE